MHFHHYPHHALENKINKEIGKFMRQEIRKKFGDAAFKQVESFILNSQTTALAHARQ